MTEQELIARLLDQETDLADCAVDCIEQMVKERDEYKARMTAMETGDWSKVRLVRFENGQLDLSAGPIPVLAEYLAQMMQNGEDKHFNFMEMQIDHKSAGPMVLSLQRKSGQTPNELRKAAEAKLTKAVELALEECPFRAGTPKYDKWWHHRRDVLAELGSEDD
jgi:hypothetical protein